MLDRNIARLNYEIDRQREQTRRCDERDKEERQLRMQALELLANLNVKSGGDFCKEFWQDVDKIVHYCLTGEHQFQKLPEKKE